MIGKDSFTCEIYRLDAIINASSFVVVVSSQRNGNNNGEICTRRKEYIEFDSALLRLYNSLL